MITYDQAFNAAITEFHISHDGLPCTVWRRGGITHATYASASVPGWLTDNTGGFFLPVERNGDDGREWHHITGVNAGDFHIADDCPRRMSDDRPPVSDRSENQPTLSNGYDEAGYDALGYDADGYDRNGYDADGYDRNGYDADGYDANGHDADGDPRPGSLDAGDLDLADLWLEFQGSHRSYSSRQPAFREYLRTLVQDPDEIDNLEFCGNCVDPAWNEDLSSAANGNVHLCESCYSEWSDCSSCEERFDGGDLYETLSESDVCESCRDRYYTYCDNCDGYYPDDDSDSHEHGYDGCCDSPQHEFRIRNDGCEPLANDTRITISLPAGSISDEGMQVIARCLRDNGQYDVSYSLDELGCQWQTKGGNFAKRLSRLAYQKYQAKILPDVLSQVGNIARDHSTSVSVTIDVTRDLNQDASYFYHDDSCWWTSYGESRCALKTNGGFGLRSLGSYDRVTGRAWVLPLRQNEDGRLVPTFETMTPDAFVVFNGYGELNGYAAPRIIAHMAGWTYRKIHFECSPMYVNAGGYLIAPEDIAEKYTDGSLDMSVRQHSSLFEMERQLSHDGEAA